MPTPEVRFSDAAQAILRGQVVRAVFGVQLQLPNETLFLTQGDSFVDNQGQRWQGLGALGQLSGLQCGPEAATSPLQMTLVGAIQESKSAIDVYTALTAAVRNANKEIRGGIVLVYIHLCDANGRAIDFPYLVQIYQLDSGSVSYDGESSQITLTGQYTIYNGTWKWSENPALIAADYVMRLIASSQTAIRGVNWEYIKDAANACDALAPMVKFNFAGGSGFEPFARMTANISLELEPRDVLAKIMAVCDGNYGVDQNGLFTMWIGQWEDPKVILTDKDICGIHEEFGLRATDEINYVHITYTEPRQNFTAIEAPIYQDALSQAQIGRRTGTIQLDYCPSPSQAWRMVRRHVMRQNGKRRIMLRTNANGMKAIGQRVVGIDAQKFQISGTFRVVQVSPGSTLADWSLELVEVTPDIFNDPSAPSDVLQAFPTVSPVATPTPAAPTLGTIRKAGGAVLNIAPTLTTNSPFQFIPDLTTLIADPSYQLDAQYSTDGGATWNAVNIAVSQLILQTPVLSSGTTVTAQIRFLPLSGTPGAWSPSASILIP